MKNFLVMAKANRLYHTCDSKGCMRIGFNERWYDYMFSVFGPERLECHAAVLREFFAELNDGKPALLRLSDLEL